MSDSPETPSPAPEGGTPLASLPLQNEAALQRELILADQDEIFALTRALNPLPPGMSFATVPDAELAARIDEARYRELPRLGNEIAFLQGYVRGGPSAPELVAALRGELAATESARASLEAQVATLEAEVARLQGEALEAEKRLDDLRVGPRRVPDDLSAALAHSLDTLQNELAARPDTLFPYAVRELTLDARVALDVSPVGILSYRVVRPGDKVEEANVSRVSLTVAPVPKVTERGIYVRPDLDPLAGVSSIPGLTARNLVALYRQRIHTLGDLLHAGTRVRAATELAALLQVERMELERWLAYARLMTIHGVTGPIAKALFAIGRVDLHALATTPPASLVLDFNAWRAAHPEETHVPLLTLLTADGWVRIARTFVGLPNTPLPDPEETPPYVEPVDGWGEVLL